MRAARLFFGQLGGLSAAFAGSSVCDLRHDMQINVHVDKSMTISSDAGDIPIGKNLPVAEDNYLVEPSVLACWRIWGGGLLASVGLVSALPIMQERLHAFLIWLGVVGDGIDANQFMRLVVLSVLTLVWLWVTLRVLVVISERDLSVVKGFVELREGVLFARIERMRLERIVDVEVEQSGADRFLNTGSIRIDAMGTEGRVITMSHVVHPERVASDIRAMMEEKGVAKIG